MQKVDIVLACFNGEKFLKDFLKSLDDQTYKDWRLIFRDDGSSDSTLKIIEEWGRGKNVCRVDDELGRLNVIGNFSECLFHTSAPYVLLADQDDVWEDRKIEILLQEIINLENGDKNLPALFCSDLTIVNEKLDVLFPSFLRKIGFKFKLPLSLRNILVQNFFPGCSMILNQALVKSAVPIPQHVLMHDWWILLVALLKGRIGFVDTCLVKYRQHQTNQIGAELRIKDIFKKIKITKENINNTFLQSELLLKLDLAKSDRDVIEKFIEIKDYSFFIKRLFLIKRGFMKNSFIKNIVFLILC